MPGEIRSDRSPLSTGACSLGFFLVSACSKYLVDVIMIYTTAYYQLLPLLMKAGPHSHNAKSFLNMTMSHIHQTVPLELGGFKSRDEFMSVSVPQLTLKSK